MKEKALTDRFVAALRTLYAARQRSIVQRLGQDMTKFSRIRFKALLAQIKEEIEFLDGRALAWARTAIPGTYRIGAMIEKERVRGATRFNPMFTIHKRAVDVLMEQTVLDLYAANSTIYANAERFIRRTQQIVESEQSLNRMIAAGILEGQARVEVSDAIQAAIERKLGKGQLITAGKRTFTPEYYAELVARTRTREAVTEGTKNACMEDGIDLVQISAHIHRREDPCTPFMGKIFSISGTDPDFPKLTETPPYHPNCWHIMTPVSKVALKFRGEFESAVARANA